MLMKFAVVKLADIDNLLDASKRETMYSLLNVIQEKRAEKGKPYNTYLVINTDETYAPDVVEILKRNGHWDPGEAIPPKASSISSLIKEAHQNAIAKGWYEEPRTFGEVIALMHSELSEALEDHRDGHDLTEVWYEAVSDVDGSLIKRNFQASDRWKPCGIPSELADVMIRIFDTCGHLGIDLEAAIREKMAYNATRPIRHGGKKL